MTNEEKRIASAELKKEIISRLKSLGDEILLTQQEIFEHKDSVQRMRNELSEKMNFTLV